MGERQEPAAGDLGAAFLADARLEFRKYKRQADRAMEQIDDAAFFRRLDPESNSVARIVKHVSGNQRSRWTDFLTTDGEKPDRDRDAEFEDDPDASRAALLASWEDGWTRLFATLDVLTPADLSRTVTIRGEPHTVLQAIDRQLTHYASHVGQIVFLAKHLAGTTWRSLSIPRGRSASYEVGRDGTPYRPGPKA
jgi:hypothetical protein